MFSCAASGADTSVKLAPVPARMIVQPHQRGYSGTEPRSGRVCLRRVPVNGVLIQADEQEQ